MGTLTKLIEYPSQDILQYVFPATQIPTWTVTNTSGGNETISVPEYSSAELAAAYSTFLAAIPTQEAEEAAAEQAEAQEIVDMINNSGASGSLAPSLISVAGRHYLRSDRWYTGADDGYGYGYYQHAEYAGTGTLPTLEWEHMGIYLPAGRKLGNITMAGRANNSEVTDIEMYMVLRYPDSPTRWETGYANDSEMDFTVVHHDMFANPTTAGTPFSGGNMLDMRRRVINLDTTVDQDCFFSIYMRPVASSTNTRYFYHTWTLEVY